MTESRSLAEQIADEFEAAVLAARHELDFALQEEVSRDQQQ